MKQGTLAERLVALLELEFRSEPAADGVPDRLWDAALWDLLRDFLSRSSKGVRARLVAAGWRVAGRDAMDIPPVLPLLVELVHAGSLIVDDVQDAAETRRDGPALHRVYGEPLAINAGCWLYFAPIVLLQRLPVPAETRLALHERMNATLLRCHEGQALDLATRVSGLAHYEVGPVVAETTRAKTGALMSLSIALGAQAAGASAAEVDALARFGEQAGVALQMYDDLSGLVRADRAHKAHEDLAGARPTWGWAWLAETTSPETYDTLRDELARAHTAEDREVVRRRLALCVTDHGRARARATVDDACRALRNTFGSSARVDELCAMIRSLEVAYGLA
ncbi:MAG: hypothetical protein EP329_13780 [Deltaproteobacteria bacterium]|nr:MAG: hypothetical protein EP329_13780 [Deltaproteobacteria bacterium]